ncbi:hypothetical protein R3I94_000191 [Phoxinus phoxinus]|uniref:Uncharacterized protein n=1 Tax=Phoxinus phoxinus TaxID=58324 RepID=A0AAN9DLV1_9TELE
MELSAETVTDGCKWGTGSDAMPEEVVLQPGDGYHPGLGAVVDGRVEGCDGAVTGKVENAQRSVYQLLLFGSLARTERGV